MSKIICFFDGCCEPKNPGGHMGYGAIVKVDGKVVLGWSGFDEASPTNTNNIAEYKSLEKIIDFLIENDLTGNDIIIRGDSQLAVRQMNGEYGMNSGAYIPYARRCLTKVAQFKRLPIFDWIPREENQEADDLSKSELKKKTGYDENVLQFGKYKGKKIDEIEDVGYLNWVLKEVRLQKPTRELIERQISRFENLAR